MRDPEVERFFTQPLVLARVIGWMKGSAALKEVGRRDLVRILSIATKRSFAVGEVLCAEASSGHPDACFFFLSGNVSVVRDGAFVVELGEGHGFGIQPMLLNQPCPATVTGVAAGEYLCFERADVEVLVRETASLRLAAAPWLASPLAAAAGFHGEVVRLTAPTGSRLPLPQLADALAQAIVADFPNDRVVVVGGPGAATGVMTAASDGVSRVTSITELDDGSGARFDYVLVAGDPGAWRIDRLVPVARGKPQYETGSAAASILPTVIIDPSAEACASLDGELVDHVYGSDTDSDLGRAAVWLDLDTDRFAAQWKPGTPNAALDDKTRIALSRWARAVTNRRVGVALSGGGSWGFYHVSVLRRMAALGIPVDVVSTASMGSAVGAYYCSHGLEGLDELVAFAKAPVWNLSTVGMLCMLSTAFIEIGVNKQLRKLQLNQLSTRFHPVATDLTSGKSFVIREGAVGLAARASASAPGVWAPTLLPVAQGKSRLVDGCVCDNLPASVLPAYGADLTLGVNCYPYGVRTAPRFVEKHPLSIFASFDLIDRIKDLVTSGSLMLHMSGDYQGEAADVYFEAHEKAHPLFWATRFTDADKIIAEADASPIVADSINELSARWQRIRLRGGGNMVDKSTPAKTMAPTASATEPTGPAKPRRLFPFLPARDHVG